PRMTTNDYERLRAPTDDSDCQAPKACKYKQGLPAYKYKPVESSEPSKRSAATACRSRSRMSTYATPRTSTSARSSGSKRTRSPVSTVRTFWPTATTSAQARRRPTAAVAGIRMPPPERRSPSAVSCRTSTRSCSIRMGNLSWWVFSLTPRTYLSSSAPTTPSAESEESDDADDHEGDRHDALHPGRPVLADQLALHITHDAVDRDVRLAEGVVDVGDHLGPRVADDGLRVHPDADLVERLGERVAAAPDVRLDLGRGSGVRAVRHRAASRCRMRHGQSVSSAHRRAARARRYAGPMSERLQPGDVAPAFTLPDADGNEVSLSDHKGRKVIVYFYPAALTPGCTKQACDFTDNLDLLAGAGYDVIGISPDTPEKLAKFREKESLKVTLLGDPDKQVLDAYGAFGEKKNYGKTYMGVIRSTIVVDEEGKVERALYNVRATGHVAKIIKDLGI
ncbi:antioxidant, AhpC/TSA family, partial [Streptomyces ipomoeae 91-03]